MERLSDEQLEGMDMWDRDVMLDERHRAVGSYLVRLAVAEIRSTRIELQQLRAAKAADRERVWETVNGAAFAVFSNPESPHLSVNHCYRMAESISSRVADALAVPGRPALSDRQRNAVANHLGWLRDRVAGTFAGTMHEGIADILNDLLSARLESP